jgi:hypothetical protein
MKIVNRIPAVAQALKNASQNVTQKLAFIPKKLALIPPAA